MGQDNAVGITAHYKLDLLGIKSQGGVARYSAPTLQQPFQLPVQLIPGNSWRVYGVDHTPASSTEVKGRVELHLSPSLCLHGCL